jgi:arylsulfatase
MSLSTSQGVLLASAAAFALVAGLPARAQGPMLPMTPAPYKGVLGVTPAKSSPPQYAPAPKAPKGAPNVLVILTDDVGFAATSTFGGPVLTPTFDRLAADGLKYNRFHTTALCSPTRAALLTGRNHHSVGAGIIQELGTGYPGYTTEIPKSAATIAEVLRQNGYSTAQFGKNHNTPDWQNNPAGPFDSWPNGLGFEYFYGFNSGEADQWAPALVENRNAVEPPADDPDYILDRDLGDRAIGWLRMQKTQAPDKPFLMYLATGTAHAPLQVPKAWADKYKGQFDQGWDTLREESFARQKALGVIPADAVLTPRPAEIPAWDSLTPDQKKVASRLTEVYAGMLAHADFQFGRVLDELKAQGELDNTIVIYIQGDNGASAEGGLTGTASDIALLNGVPFPADQVMARLDHLGDRTTTPHYPSGFAWAMDTPFQWTKQVASHFGGTRNGMVVSWPAGIKAKGELRTQFSHVIDIAPTLYDAIGIKPPSSVNGVAQQPIEGVSMVPTFASAKAPETHTTQYFEMFGNRALYKDGWVAATRPLRLPWVLRGQTFDAESFTWELYNVEKDFSEANDLAAREPARLKALQDAFMVEARKHNVLPLDTRAGERMPQSLRPFAMNDRTDFTFYAGPRINDHAFPELKNRSWTMTATVDVAGENAQGVVAAQGGNSAGWALAAFDGHPTFIYNFFALRGQTLRLRADKPLPPGRHTLAVDFRYDGGGMGKGANIALKVDGAEVARGRMENTVPGWWQIDGVGIGRDFGTAVVEDYKVPFPFTGRVERLDIHVARPAG